MILLDTHVLLWLDQDTDRLGANTRQLLDASLQDNELSIAAISFWEVAMLARKKRIQMALDMTAWRRDLIRAGLQEIVLDGSIGIAATVLDGLHPDPADRMIVATAIHASATLVTADERLLDWTGSLERFDARE